MMRSRQKERWIIYILAVLLCLVLASFWLMCNIYAKYSTEASGSDEARVAIFGHNQSITLSDENAIKGLIPGASFSYTLKVANYDATKISEVALKYSLEIATAGNLPLIYMIYKQDGENKKELGRFAESPENKVAQFTNDAMQFVAGTKEECTYNIEVQWPENQKDKKYAGVPDDITVYIRVDQID